MGAVLDAVPQHVDGPATGDLSRQLREKLAPRRSVLGELQRFGRLGLGCAKKCGELDEIDAVLSVVVVEIAAAPAAATVAGQGFRYGASIGRLAGMACQPRGDEALDPPFGCVRGHVSDCASTALSSRRSLQTCQRSPCLPRGRRRRHRSLAALP